MLERALRVMQANLQPSWGGGEQLTFSLGSGLRARGHRVSFLCDPKSALGKRVEAEGMPVSSVATRSAVDLLALREFVGHLHRERPDVLHCHTSREWLLAVAAGRLARVPVIVATRHVALPVSRATRWMSNRHCDQILCVSRAVQEQLLACRIDEHRTRVVYGAIDVDGFRATTLPALEARRRLGIPLNGPVVGMVGSLIAPKGPHDFLRAAGRLAETGLGAHFALAGEGAARGELEALAARFGIRDRVHFLGFRRDVPSVLSAFDVLVFPSSAPEAFPLAILEGMAAGRPIVATRVPGGVPEVIEDRVTGLLVPPKDPESISRSVKELLADPALSTRLAAAASERVLQRHNLPAMLDETEGLYRELFATPPLRQPVARAQLSADWPARSLETDES
jgi:glycosyltransferase involved in cell wall biosynthesis